MNFQHFSPKTLWPVLYLSILVFTTGSFAEQAKLNPSPRRITYAEAQKLLVNEKEGNLDKQVGKFTRTKLSDGRVLEVFYPLTANSPGRKGKALSVPGYGLIYDSDVAFKETTKPRHALEDLIPDGRVFVGSVSLHVMKLEKRVGKLDYTRSSLRRLDNLIAGYHASHTTAQTDQQTFQEVTAYYGEVMRRELKAEWKPREVKLGLAKVQVEPNLVFVFSGKSKELRPWSTVLQAMSNEDSRGVRLSKLFEDELRAAQQ